MLFRLCAVTKATLSEWLFLYLYCNSLHYSISYICNLIKQFTMSKPKLSKSAIVDIIVKELSLGATRETILAKVDKLCQISGRTIDRYLADAREIYAKRTEEINRVATELAIKEEKKVVRKAIMTKIERMEVASMIASGRTRKATIGDRIRALDYLSKIEGDYAPEQIDLIGQIKPIEFSVIKNKKE